MFDILFGRKFSNKCKHSVKYIKCRIETIRKKKQVIARYLKKDVADLLAAGHDANAFGRIDALIIEINHASCYDMIEQYCGCLSENLSTMCKERECPKEAMEAAATLIFAAARFSDLPELTDLRSVFTKRYGTRMESCIDKEFVDKTQKKSFSKARKLQLMEDIAQEFSVNWNSNMFENKMINQPAAPTHLKAMQDQLVSKENQKLQHQNEGIGLIAAEKQPSAGVVHRDFKASETIAPPYIKFGSINGTIADHGGLAHTEASEDVKEVDHRPVNDSRRRDFNSHPPYTKPKLNNTEYEKSNGVQGNMPKDETFEDDSDIVSQIQTKQGRETARTNGIHGDIYDGERFVIKQTSSSRRRRDRRQAVEIAKDGGNDKVEEIMDKLLMHYSKKGTDGEPRRTRTKRREAPKEPMADAARVLEHFDEHKRHPHTLPRELTIPTG